MGDRSKPSVYSIPAHRGFADALATGLIDRFGENPLSLSNGIILIPNNRAGVAINEAFVRRSDDAMLLPRMVAVGDLDLGENLGAALDPLGSGQTFPPAITPMARIFCLAEMISQEQWKNGEPVNEAESVRLARDMASTIDQLLVENIDPRKLLDVSVAPELSAHWQKSLNLFNVLIGKWPEKQKAMNCIDAAQRRNLLLGAVSDRWREKPPNQYVVAAGITTSAPAVAKLLRTISDMPRGMVVFPGLDLHMPDEEWNMIGPFDADPSTGFQKSSIETHPQFHLKLLLERMAIDRAEIMRWYRSGESDAPPARSQAISNAFVPAMLTGKWRGLDPAKRSLARVEYIETKSSAEEAQSIALLVREALETDKKRVAIITSDRVLATRVSAHLKRWNIEADDSAGQPLSSTPSGVLFIALLKAWTTSFAPVELLSLLKHPLVMAGEERLAWLENVRSLDILLRGPRPRPGLDGINAMLAEENPRTKKLRDSIGDWWSDTAKRLSELEGLSSAQTSWQILLGVFKKIADDLSGGVIWSGVAGRALADLLVELDEFAPITIRPMDGNAAEDIVQGFMSDIAVRPPYGGHPRVAIYGLLEARLQQADLVICSGLNEGTWPQIASPDPWLAPMVRKELGLPSLERRIGLAAHDLAGAMGAPDVVLTRAKRDDNGPAIASRFLLRFKAMAGEHFREKQHVSHFALNLDKPTSVEASLRPNPKPSAEQRKVDIAVTDMDRLKADPFAFYARKILLLNGLDDVDADPNAAWRGTIVHDVLEKWGKEDGFAAKKLLLRTKNLLSGASSHPLTKALWEPRLLESISWVAREVSEKEKQGQKPVLIEEWGSIKISGVSLGGKVDRLDALPDGTAVIIDYKTGQPPTPKAINAGYSLQLGLLGLIAERGGFKGFKATAKGFEYWSLAKKAGTDSFGYISSPVDDKGTKSKKVWSEFTAHAELHFRESINSWILGEEPFTAKLHPEFAPYADYDQLMRLGEWYGREEDKQ